MYLIFDNDYQQNEIVTIVINNKLFMNQMNS